MSDVHNDWQTIYRHLMDDGFDTYSMGQHKGLCKSPYIVVKGAGSVTRINVADKRYELIIYVPVTSYSKMEEFAASVKRSMQRLAPSIRLWRDESPHYLDNDVQAYMTSITYRTAVAADYVGI